MKKLRGFTLIEVIAYTALFSIFIGVSIAATHQIIDSINKNSGQILLEEEGRFIVGKLDWALTGATEVMTTPTTLSLVTSVFETPIQFTFHAGNQAITLQRESFPPLQLNSRSVAVFNPRLIKTDVRHGKPGFISISFELKVNKAMGRSKTFSLVKHLLP